VEYQRLVKAITKTFLVISPLLSVANKAEVHSFFQQGEVRRVDLRGCEEVQDLLRVINGLPVDQQTAAR
jgi:hypothetical protein